MFDTKLSRRIVRSAAVETLESRVLLTSVVVNTTLDGNPAGLVSLRDAIAIANSSATPTAITFSPTIFATPKTITLNSTVLELSNTSQATTITGPKVGVTISGNNATRVFLIDTGVTVSMSSLTVTKGFLKSAVITTDGGAGINNNGTLTLNNVTISANNGNSLGGGIRNVHSLTATDSTFSNNVTSYAGGAIYCSSEPNVPGRATMTLINDTIAGNSAGAGEGAAIFNDDYTGGSSVTIDDSTISNNSDAAGGLGGAVYNTPPVRGTTPFNVSNSIIAGNVQKTGNADVFGTFISHGHNLIGEKDGTTGWSTADFTGTVAKPLSAKLGALASNGGLTQTMLPLIGSPAINKGSNALIPTGITTDQRGLKRIVDNVVDIGAVEVAAVITVTPPASQTASPGTSKVFSLGSFTQSNAVGPFKVTINWGDGSAVTVLSVAAAGTIPATAHTYASGATDTVSISITDADKNVSNTATFKVVVAGATISGRVFDDANGDGKVDTGELGLGLWQVYIDVGNKGVFKNTDPNVLTDAQGNWSFTGLAAGTYIIRIVQFTGTKTTTPNGGLLTIKVAGGLNSTGNLFGED
jgi:predicted outer membrane repeat protein